MDLQRVKPYAHWIGDVLHLPLEVDYNIVGEISVTLISDDIERDFIISQMTLVADLLCSAISRQLIIVSNQTARMRAEESERSTKEFVAMINHELRTPLNGLLGSAELLSDTPLDKEQSDLLQNLTHSGDLLRHIINDILDFSKMSAGMMELIPTRFCWQDIVNMLVGIFEPKAIDKGISFEIIEMSSIPKYLIGDFERICQILVNLVGNAVKFTAAGSVRVEASWEQGRLLVGVSDTGVGIDSNALEQLFDPFVQADRTATRSFEGTGLGLAICKNLVVLMNGEIMVSSVKGVGSQFNIALPLTEAADKERVSERKTSHVRNESFDSLSILVVDDIRMNQVIINQMLKKLSITPVIATNGIEAISAVTDAQYDLIFMDCRMPEMDGFEATQCLREQKYALPIIALTAGTTLEEREKCISSGMDDILTKPYTAQDLKLMIEKWAFPTSDD
jgi:signal transduction histidine kinase/CheY-like chemotaxis protein